MLGRSLLLLESVALVAACGGPSSPQAPRAAAAEQREDGGTRRAPPATGQGTLEPREVYAHYSSAGAVDLPPGYFQGKYDACFDEVLALNPTVAGTAMVEFEAPLRGGSPLRISVRQMLFEDFFYGRRWLDPRPLDASFLSCLTKATEALHLPPQKASASVEVALRVLAPRARPAAGR